MATTFHTALQNIATTITNWLQEQHLLAASSSSFISCRPKATTNGEEEMSASAPFHHMSHRAMVTTTSYATFRQWQQRSHFVSHEPIISRRFHIASRNGDSNNNGCGNNICYPPAPRLSTTCHVKAPTKRTRYCVTHGDDSSYCVA